MVGVPCFPGAETLGMAPQPRRKLTAYCSPVPSSRPPWGCPWLPLPRGAGSAARPCTYGGQALRPRGWTVTCGTAIQEGHEVGELALLRRLHRAAANGDTKAVQWLLTHDPQWRETCSDSSAERRTVVLVL